METHRPRACLYPQPLLHPHKGIHDAAAAAAAALTGGNSGVGWETSKHLALKGAHVIIATHVYTPGDSTSPADEIGGPE